MKKTGKRRADSPFRQFYLAGIHVNTDKLRQLDCWLALAPDIASKSDATNSWSHAADHAHFEHPRNRITDVSVNTVYLLGRTGVLKDFNQLAPTGRILLFSGTRGHRSAKSIRWGRVKQRDLGLPLENRIKTSSHLSLFPTALLVLLPSSQRKNLVMVYKIAGTRYPSCWMIYSL